MLKRYLDGWNGKRGVTPLVANEVQVKNCQHHVQLLQQSLLVNSQEDIIFQLRNAFKIDKSNTVKLTILQKRISIHIHRLMLEKCFSTFSRSKQSSSTSTCSLCLVFSRLEHLACVASMASSASCSRTCSFFLQAHNSGTPSFNIQ